MGSASSKPAARKLARAPPAWAGARTPGSAEQAAHPHARPIPRASEIKDEAIMQDARDPQFLANLSKLGAVTVDHHMQTIRPAAVAAQQMFQTRIRSEDQARSSRPTPNHLLAQSLVDLLEERKYSKSKKELESLAHKYSIDLEKLERLARHVNSTSIDQTSVERWVGRDGNENVSVMTKWVNPTMREETL